MKLPRKIIHFLEKPNYMVLGTINKSGMPQMSVVWFEYKNGLIKFSTTTDRVKYKNILKNKKAACLIYDISNPYHYLHIQGQAAKIKKDLNFKFGTQLCKRYNRGMAYAKSPERKKEKRVIISIKPLRWFYKEKPTR